MNSIRKRCYALTVISITSAFLTAWFAIKPMPEAAFIIGLGSAALFILLLRQSRHLYDAKLICDNRILIVPSAVITKKHGSPETKAQETIVSTFGILIGSKMYKWGCHGVHGVRLKAIDIDQRYIYVIFGDGAKSMRVELLHGITDLQTVTEVKQKLWHETGIEANISNWERAE